MKLAAILTKKLVRTCGEVSARSSAARYLWISIRVWYDVHHTRPVYHILRHDFLRNGALSALPLRCRASHLHVKVATERLSMLPSLVHWTYFFFSNPLTCALGYRTLCSTISSCNYTDLLLRCNGFYCHSSFSHARVWTIVAYRRASVESCAELFAPGRVVECECALDLLDRIDEDAARFVRSNMQTGNFRISVYLSVAQVMALPRGNPIPDS